MAVCHFWPWILVRMYICEVTVKSFLLSCSCMYVHAYVLVLHVHAYVLVLGIVKSIIYINA